MEVFRQWDKLSCHHTPNFCWITWENTKTHEDRTFMAKGNLLLVKYLKSKCIVLSKTWNKKWVMQIINLYLSASLEVLFFKWGFQDVSYASQSSCILARMNKYFEYINIISATSVFVPWFALSSFLLAVYLLLLIVPPFLGREAGAPVALLQMTRPGWL